MAKHRRMSEEELQDPETWDFDAAERHSGRGAARAVVSVAFQRSDFEKVATCAEQSGKKTSEFIREAALEKAQRQTQPGSVTSFSGTLGSYAITEHPLASTRGPRSTDEPRVVMGR
jgi:hypothetical protein